MRQIVPSGVVIQNGNDSWPHGYRVVVKIRNHVTKQLICSHEELLQLARTFRDDAARHWPEATVREWLEEKYEEVITRQKPDRNYTGWVKTPLGDIEYRERGECRRVHAVALDQEASEYGWRARL